MFLDAFFVTFECLLCYGRESTVAVIMWPMTYFTDSGNQDFGELVSARSQGREKTQETARFQDRLRRATYLHFCILSLTLLRARCYCRHVSYAMR